MHTHIHTHNPSPNRLSETNFRTNVTSFASGFTAASFWALFSFCFYSTYIIYEALFCVKMLSIPWVLSPTACHILECSDGLAQSVINTIGQAFELQFKQYLHSPPKTMAPMERWHWKLIFLPELKKKNRHRPPNWWQGYIIADHWFELFTFTTGQTSSEVF